MEKTIHGMSNGDQHHFSLTSTDQFYPDSSYTTQLVQTPREGESKLRKRRRKRSKAVGASGETSSNEMLPMKKRKLTKEQVSLLELSFGNEHKLESEKKDRLALELCLDPRQVAVWFQNRRARWKNKKLEEEYSKLKSSHDSVVVEKCSLESKVLKLNEEVLKLNEDLSEAKKEMQRLSELRSSLTAGSTGIMTTSTGSPSSSMSSSLSMVTDHQQQQQQQFTGEFEVDEFENFLYSPFYYYNNYNWVNLYGGF